MNRLLSVITKILIGAFSGLLVGLTFGLLIWLITLLVGSSLDMPPREVAAFLGMGFGTVVGAVFGGLVGLNEK